MSGVSISVTVVDQETRRAFDTLSVVMRSTQPVMHAIGVALVGSTHQRFVTQTDPDGQAWQALNPEYAKGKRNSRILTESGRLRDSINAQAGRDEVRIGTNVIYGRIHQEGGTIEAKNASHLFFRMGDRFVQVDSVTLPARPYLGISRDDEAEISEIVFSFLDRYSRR